MKVLLFSGDHPRHLYIHGAVLSGFEVCGVVCMRREEMVPTPPAGTREHDAKNFIRHFEDRKKAELKYFGDVDAETVFGDVPTHYCDRASFNSAETATFVESHRPDMVFIYGTTLIKDPILSVLPKDRVNMHLGLSPWYRGAATLFWPFYDLRPQYAGSTFHQIVPKADAGAIIHQSKPTLVRGDGIHDVACKTLMQSASDMKALLKTREKEGYFKETLQTSTGRLYLEKDFRPEHLRVIYDLFENRIVDMYLDGELQHGEPAVISGLN